MVKKGYKNGFTLLETIVSIGIITIGLTSALALISNSLFYVLIIKDRLITVNLAGEGAEITRNIRDNNWFQSLPWNNSLSNGDYQAAYNSVALASYNGNALLLDSGTGLYSYISGMATPYVRKISIVNLSSYELRVISTVTWQRRGITYTTFVEDHLFNWK